MVARKKKKKDLQARVHGTKSLENLDLEFVELLLKMKTILIFILLQVHTVGPDYAHAEARKSPALDGKVERDSDGKEVRFPVILTAKEKLIARKVCLAFKVK